MSQEQLHGVYSNEDEDVEFEGPAGQERREKLIEETDDLLDYIDGVLESEQTVIEFKQQGGE